MKIVSDKDLFITTLGGTAVRFEAGVPREISEEIALLAIQQGAVEIGKEAPKEEPTLEIEDEVVVQEPVQDEKLIEVLQKLIEEADPNSFKNDGTPKAAVVNKMLGRTVRAEEREAAWELALNA
jgi:sRNA-binding carbon storage regulator CsrA